MNKDTELNGLDQQGLIDSLLKKEQLIDNLLKNDSPVDMKETVEELFMDWVSNSPDISHEVRKLRTGHVKCLLEFFSDLYTVSHFN